MDTSDKIFYFIFGLSILLYNGCKNPNLDPLPNVIAFSGLTANGSSMSVTTTELTLTFDIDPTSLSVSDISLTGATKGLLSGTGTTRTLTISEITVNDSENITVTIANPHGFTITPLTKSVVVYVYTPDLVNFTNLSANGTSGSITTTELTLTFDIDPTGLSVSDISLTGATKGLLSGTGTTRTLTISEITVNDSENITITIANPHGYTITPASRNVPVFMKLYRLGDIGPSGIGTVFYISAGGLHGMEAAPNTWNGSSEDPKIAWKNEDTNTTGTSTSIGTGYSNTYIFMNNSDHPAAALCRSYTGGGYTDWFLPSTDELNQMYINKALLSAFVNNEYWASSSEGNDTGARTQYMPDGTMGWGLKTSLYYVRPARSF